MRRAYIIYLFSDSERTEKAIGFTMIFSVYDCFRLERSYYTWILDPYYTYFPIVDFAGVHFNKKSFFDFFGN